jgi:hypothetical protein
MESADLNSPRHEDAALAALLRQHRAPVPDDGFTHRVLAALPPIQPVASRAGVVRSWWPWVAYLGGGLAGTLFAFTRVSSWSDLLAGVGPLGDAWVALGLALAEPWFVLALMLCALSLAISLPFIRPRTGPEIWR